MTKSTDHSRTAFIKLLEYATAARKRLVDAIESGNRDYDAIDLHLADYKSYLMAADLVAQPTKQLRYMLQENLTAWEGEEESVKEEHAQLITDTRNLLKETA